MGPVFIVGAVVSRGRACHRLWLVAEQASKTPGISTTIACANAGLETKQITRQPISYTYIHIDMFVLWALDVIWWLAWAD